MIVSKMKKNSMVIPKKIRLIDYANKHEKNIQKNNLHRIQPSHNNKPEIKPKNNLYLNSEFNIQKESNEIEPITYIKSVPSKVVKKHYYITPTKPNNKNNAKINKNPPSDITKMEKNNEDSLSTFPLTKESMIVTPRKNSSMIENFDEPKNNMRSLSCAQRNKNQVLKNKENMIFVKKKIQGLNSSFMLNKSQSDVQENNSCCFFGEYPQQYINFNPNNSMDYCSSNYYNKNYMNIINNLDRNQGGNSVLITNNNINLITNNNFISSNKDNNDDKDNIYIRSNNSVTCRNKYNKKISKIRVVQSIKGKNSMMVKKPRNNKNMITYLDHISMNNRNNYNIITNDTRFYASTKERDNKNKKKNISYVNNNINYITRDYNGLSPRTNNSPLKDLNFEDLYLLMQKFELIKNNFILLGNLKYSSNKQLLENINMSRIFIYYLYKFYLGSSFEGCPQNLYNDKHSKLYLHFYSVTLIISLGLMYIITHKIKMTKDYQEKLLMLLNMQFKAYLIFCDSMINKINYNIDDNDMKDIWINEIIHELNNRKILYTVNHISQIKLLSIDSYKLFNEMIRSINYSYTDRSYSKHSEAEIFLYKHFHNKTINYLAQIKINELEDIFDKNIFRIINLRSNFANITSLKSNIISSNQRTKQHQKLNSTSFVFRNENISSNNYNKYEFSIKPVLMLNKNKPKNHQKNNSGINPKQILQNLKVKEPYLDFPPSKEYTLVLDLDETMISFQFTQPQKGIGQMHLRPGLENFLDVIKEYYEIIVFTSGTREYADMVLDVIEHKKKKKLFSGRLYREHTTKIGKKYIKDLSKLGRDLSRTLIVDNLPQSFKFQHENGILISSFYVDENDKKDDRALIELQKILIKIYEDKRDVRLSILKYKEDIIRNVSCLDLRKAYNDD